MFLVWLWDKIQGVVWALKVLCVCVCVCVCARARARVRVCVCACVRVCMRVYMVFFVFGSIHRVEIKIKGKEKLKKNGKMRIEALAEMESSKLKI